MKKKQMGLSLVMVLLLVMSLMVIAGCGKEKGCENVSVHAVEI